MKKDLFIIAKPPHLKVVTFKEGRAYCPDCKVELKDTGNVLYSDPLQYKHICPKCQQTFNLNTSYPFMDKIKKKS